MNTRVVVLVLLASCVAPRQSEPEPDTPETPTTTPTPVTTPPSVVPPSTPRLTRLLMDGTPAPAGSDPDESDRFHDATLNIDCRFLQTGEANEWRCIPDRRASTVLFLDDSCSQPITIRNAPTCGATPTPYATNMRMMRDDPLHSVWGMAVDLYSVGAQVAKPSKVYESFAGRCTEQPAVPAGDAFALTKDSGAAMAHAKLEWIGNGAVKQPRIVPDDAGPIADIFGGTALNTKINKHCYFDNSGVCDAFAPDVSVAYTDASCNTAVTTLDYRATLVTDHNSNKRVVTSSTQQTVYDNSSGTCEEFGSQYVLTLGDVVMDPSGTVVDVGAGRVRDRRVESAGLSFFLTHVDSQSNEPCYAMLTSDLKRRCVASDFFEYFFTDSSCSHAIFAGYDDITYGRAYYYPADACSAGFVIAEVGTKLPTSTAMLYKKSARGSCTEVEYFEGYVTRYEVGAIIPPTTFPEMP